jgi:hypothetical protein
MTQINPFTGSIVQAPQVQRTQAAEKDRQLRKVTDLSKNAALQGDQLQHEVESSEALTPAQDEQPRKNPRQSRKKPRTSAEQDDGESHIDVTA